MNRSTNPMTPQTVQRLAFIRYLHEMGVAQSAQPEPLSATAILCFQDAVEHFLLLSADHLKINLPSDMKFLQYWEKLQPHLPQGQSLPSKQALDRVNKLRVSLKHYGTIPSSTAVAQAKADVSTFFTDATQLIFGVEFVEVDMIDLVTRRETVRLLREAQTHAVAGDYISAMAGLTLAFRDLIDYYTEGPYITASTRSPFRFGPNLRPFRAVFEYEDFGKGRARQVAALTEITLQIQEAMQVISLGIDFARYAQFALISPKVEEESDGTTKIFFDNGHKLLTEDDYRAGRVFVIESALQAVRAEAVLQRRHDHFVARNDTSGIEEKLWTGPATTI